MLADRDPGGELPLHWLAALDAVADACATERTASAPTRLIARRLHGADGSHMARAVLRMLRRHGYVSSIQNIEQGAPIRWTLTAAGRDARVASAIHGRPVQAQREP
jgi:ribosomal protein S8